MCSFFLSFFLSCFFSFLYLLFVFARLFAVVVVVVVLFVRDAARDCALPSVSTTFFRLLTHSLLPLSVVSAYQGFILDFSGPVPAGINDITLYRAVASGWPADFAPREIVADRGYESSEFPELLHKLKRIAPSLPADECLIVRVWHALLERVRVMAENVFARIAQFRLVGDCFRSAFHRHVHFVFIAASLTQLEMLISPIRDTELCDAHRCAYDLAYQGEVALGLLMTLASCTL